MVIGVHERVVGAVLAISGPVVDPQVHWVARCARIALTLVEVPFRASKIPEGRLWRPKKPQQTLGTQLFSKRLPDSRQTHAAQGG